MAILEGLGPKGKLFEDLPFGKYLFEVGEPGDHGWIREFVDDKDPEAKTYNYSWSLRVIRPEEFENRRFSHMTMFDATPEKIAQAMRPYNPSGFTYQFLVEIGVAVKDGNDAIILDDYLTDGKFDPNKTIGVRFHGTIISDTFKTKSGEQKTKPKLTTIYPE